MTASALAIIAPLLAGCLAYDALSRGDGGVHDASAAHDASFDMHDLIDGADPFDMALPKPSPDAAYSTPLQYVGESKAGPVTGSAITIPIPLGTQVHDYVLIAVRSSNSSNTLMTFPTCPGGAEIGNMSTFSMYWCVLPSPASPTGYSFTFTFASSSALTALATSYRFVATPKLLVNQTYEAADSQSLTVPAEGVVVAMLGYQTLGANDPNWSAPTGFEILPQIDGLVFFDAGTATTMAPAPKSFPFSFANTDNRGDMLTAFAYLSPP